jgi:hypothetical protein
MISVCSPRLAVGDFSRGKIDMTFWKIIALLVVGAIFGGGAIAVLFLQAFMGVDG